MMKIQAIKNLTGCGEMSNYTFSLTVTDEVAGSAPMSEQEMVQYITFALDGEYVIKVLNIVRDY